MISKDTSKQILKIFVTDLFYCSFIFLIIYLLVELLIPGLIVYYFNLNYLMLLCLVAGGIMVSVTAH